jgi:hypothetical protein
MTMPLQGRPIATGLGFPEGPVVLPDGSVLVVEIAAGRLTRVLANGELKVIAHVGGGPNGAAMGPDGYCYICNNGGFSWRTDHGFTRPTGEAADYKGGSIQRVDLATGEVETLYTHCDGFALHGPNDIVFDTQGGFWFTDFGKKFACVLPKRRPARIPRGSRELLHQHLLRRSGHAYGLHYFIGLWPALCGAVAQAGSAARRLRVAGHLMRDAVASDACERHSTLPMTCFRPQRSELSAKERLLER